MKFIKRTIIFIIFIFVSGCAGPRVTVVPHEKIEFEEKVWEITEEITEKDVFLTASLEYMDTGDQDEFYRKVLGDWQKPLHILQKDDSNFYISINISVPVIEQIKRLKQDQLEIGEHLIISPEKLSESQIEQLTGEYRLDLNTGTIISYQVEEVLNYFDQFLLEQEPLKDIVKKSSPTVTDKNTVLNFMEKKLLNFEQELFEILNKDNVEEATTSLSDSYLNVLNPRRRRAHLMESLISYNRWRDTFPSGFIPRQGFLDESSIDLIKPTPVKWITVLSTSPVEYLNTAPQVIFTDSYFYNNNSSTSVIKVAGRLPREVSPLSIIVSFDQLEYFVKSDLLNFISFEDVKNTIEYSAGKEVRLSTSVYTPVKVDLEGRLGNVKRILEDTYQIIDIYQNSGRGRMDIVRKIQNKLLKIESGLLHDSLDKNRYDRFFRNTLLNIYRKIGQSPPGNYFLPVIEKDPSLPDKEMSSMVDVNINGEVEKKEWAGAFKLDRPVNGVEKIYTGMDEENIYYMFKIDTGTVKELGVFMGTIGSGSPALVARSEKEITLDNIQDFPICIEVLWRRDRPGSVNIYRAGGIDRWEHLTRYYDVEFKDNYVEFSVPFRYLGVKSNERIFFKFFNNEQIFPQKSYYIKTAPEFGDSDIMASFVDPAGDNYGPGNYRYPQKLEDKTANLDFRGIQFENREDEKVIRVELGALDNPDKAPYGFSYPVVDLYIDINNIPGSGRTQLLPDRNAYTTSQDAWEYCISVSGYHKSIYNTSFNKIGEPEVSVSPFENKINIFIPDELVPASLENFHVIPVLMAANGADGKIQRVDYEDTKSTVTITGRREESDTNILDVILPSGYSQREILGGNRRGGAIEIPALKIKE